MDGCGTGDRVYVRKVNKELFAFSTDPTNRLIAGITTECVLSGGEVEVIVQGHAKINKYTAAKIHGVTLNEMDELIEKWKNSSDRLEDEYERNNESE